MGKVIAGATMSLDGFMADPNGDLSLLYPDLEAMRETEWLQESIRTTGAAVIGQRAYAMADPDWYLDNYEYQVPILVLTHKVPERAPRQGGKLSFTFVTDGIESAVGQAKAAAGDKDVTIIGGASTLQQCLKAGLADELHIDVMPVFLGGGLRPFEASGIEQLRLERIKVMALLGGRTHLEFRVW